MTQPTPKRKNRDPEERLTVIETAGGRAPSLKDRIVEYGILALVLFSPLPAASVYDWSLLVIECGVMILAAVHWLAPGRTEPEVRADGAAKWVRRLWTAFIIFLLVQVVPLPGPIVRILSPETFARKSPYASGSGAWMSLSLVPDRTLRQGLFLASCVLLGTLVVATLRHRDRISRMIWALIGLGVFESLYGLLQLYSGNPRILFYPKTYNLDSVTGTFVNRNHFSGCLEMIIPLAIGLAVSRMNVLSSAGARLRDKALQLSEKHFLVNTALYLSVLIMGLGIVFSKSRSGVFIFTLIFLLFFGGILLVKEKLGERKKSIVLALQVLFVAIVGISLYAGVSSTLARFGMDKFLREQRPLFWAGTIRQFSGFPVFGTGLGTFASVYPGSEENGIPIHIYHAHNDYLEYLSELGVLGSLLLAGALGSTILLAWRKWGRRRRSGIRSLALGGFISILAILLHSLTDFNMQIPANLVLFTVVVSLTLAIVGFRGGSSRGVHGTDPQAAAEDGLP
jgi:O-antigen ligase